MTKKKIFALSLAIIFSLSTNVFSQSDPARFLRWMKDDPVSLIHNIGPDQLATIATFGTAVAAVSLSDATTSSNMQLYYKNSNLLHLTNYWGDWEFVAPVSVGLFGASLLTKDSKFQDAAFTSLQSLVMTNIIINTSKFLFARSRPGDNDGPYDIDFVQFGETSFPSGHAATAFAFITPWVVYYPGIITYSLLAIPTGTAIARVAKGKHWFSDVAAGAAVGISIGYYLSKKHLGLQSDRLQVMPSAGRDNFSLTVNFSF